MIIKYLSQYKKVRLIQVHSQSNKPHGGQDLTNGGGAPLL